MVIADYYGRITGAAPNYADTTPNFVRNLFVVYKGLPCYNQSADGEWLPS